MTPPKMNVSIRLPETEFTALRIYCARKRTTVQAIVEPLIRKWIQENRVLEELVK